MSLLKRLFGGGPRERSNEPAAVEHKGFTIYPDPGKAEGGYRIGARIEKDVGGETKTHHMIRADVISDPAEAEKASVGKAQQMIDEQGERIFG